MTQSIHDDLTHRGFESEIGYSTSRSSGPGGQNVNKVNTKVELRFNVNLSSLLSDSEKELIISKLKNRITVDGELLLVSQSERSQLLNKSLVTEKFYDLLANALTIQKKRRSTQPTFTSKIKRLEKKKIRGIVKKLRKDRGLSAD